MALIKVTTLAQGTELFNSDRVLEAASQNFGTRFKYALPEGITTIDINETLPVFLLLFEQLLGSNSVKVNVISYNNAQGPDELVLATNRIIRCFPVLKMDKTAATMVLYDTSWLKGYGYSVSNIVVSQSVDEIAKVASVNFLIPSIPDTDLSCRGEKAIFIANSAQAFGDVVFINNSGKAQVGNSIGMSTATGIAILEEESVEQNVLGIYLLSGFIRNDAWSWNVGGMIYLSHLGISGFTMTQNPPTSENSVTQVLGVAVQPNVVYFKPSLAQVEYQV